LEELHNLRMWIAFHNSNNNNRPPGWKWFQYRQFFFMYQEV
jgi:hypothetical protein